MVGAVREPPLLTALFFGSWRNLLRACLFVIPRETRNLPKDKRFLVSLGMTNKQPLGVERFSLGTSSFFSFFKKLPLAAMLWVCAKANRSTTYHFTGNLNHALVPKPGSLSKPISPLCSSIIALQTYKPNPLP